MEYQHGQPRILVVDDDKSDRIFARRALENQDYFIFEAINGQRLREILHEHAVDLILLDLKLPGEDGMNLIASIRDVTNAPIIIVSGLQNLSDKQAGLNNGADDYITKPFYPEELQARIHANLRRYKTPPPDEETASAVQFGRWTLDKQIFDVRDDKQVPLGLTIHEYRLLEKLIEASGRTLTRDELAPHPCKRGVDVHITRIRKKLADPDLIKTVRGMGYRLDTVAHP